MIDMNKYKKKILHTDREKKVKNNIGWSIIVFNLYICFFLIALIVLLIGLFGIANKTNYGWSLYFVGMLIIILDVIILMGYESYDPLKEYSTNDKLFIYLAILNESLGAYKIKSPRLRFKGQYLFYTARMVNKQMYKIQNNIENTFIFRDENYKYYEKFLDQFHLLLQSKNYKNKIQEIQKCIADIISIYELNIVNEFVNEDCSFNDRESRINKIEALYARISDILVSDIDSNDDSRTLYILKNDKQLKIEAISKIIFIIILNIMPFTFIKHYVGYIESPVALVGLLFTIYPSIIALSVKVWKFKWLFQNKESKKAEKNSD